MTEIQDKHETATEQTTGEPKPNEILFWLKQDSVSVPILRMDQNGDIFVKGKLIDNDMEVVNAMREFLIDAGLIHRQTPSANPEGDGR